VKLLPPLLLTDGWKERINELDTFMAESSANQTIPSFTDKITENVWWNYLDSALFPERHVHRSAYSSVFFSNISFLQFDFHRDRNLRLMERLGSVRDQTQAAFHLNSQHLSDKAKELNQLADGAQVVRRFMVPDAEAHQAMMDDLYEPEEEDHTHSI